MIYGVATKRICSLLAVTQTMIGLVIMILTVAGVSIHGEQIEIWTVINFVAGFVTLLSGVVLYCMAKFLEVLIEELEDEED